MLRHLIFDWSGTLADDRDLALRLTNETLSQFGGDRIDLDTYRNEYNPPADSFYGPLLPGVSIADVDQFFFDRYEKKVSAVSIFPPLDFVCHYARMNDLQVFILSTLENRLIEPVLKRHGILEHFTAVWGGAFNKAETLPKHLNQFDIEPDEACLIGDMPHDIQTAKTCGLMSGAALYGHADQERLRASAPDFVFETPQSIFEWLQKYITQERIPRPTPVVGGLIYNDKNEVLLVRQKKWSSLWCAPGGKIDYGESIADAFRREIAEETGLKLRDIEFVSVDEGIESDEFREARHFVFVNFRARAISENVQSNYEAFEWKWVTLDVAVKMELNSPTRKLIEKEAKS